MRLSRQKNDRAGRIILLIEDDRGTASAIRRFLEIGGFKVMHYSTGDSAVAALESDALPESAVLLTDLYYPGTVSGFELINRFSACRPHTPIVLMSGSCIARDRPDDYARLIKQGVRVIEKPVSGVELMDIISTLIGGRT